MSTPTDIPLEVPQAVTTLPPLNLIRNKPRLAKEGFKTFQGLAADERHMLINSIHTILDDQRHEMAQYIGRVNSKKYQEEAAHDSELSMDELRVLVAKVTRTKYVKLTGPPYRIKYHTDFLKQFQPNAGIDQPGSQTQTANISTQIEHVDSDDDSTVIPPNVIKTPTRTEQALKKPRTQEQMEQTTLTQQWTPRPTQELDFDIEVSEEQNETQQDLTEEELERRRRLAAVVNPYSQSKAKRTPTVTPQKLTPHTKPKAAPLPRTNLKDPPIYSPLAATQPNKNNNPMAELEEIVQHTEKILDAATAEFHKVNKDGEPIIATGTIIEGLGTLQPTTTSNQHMHSLIQYMDALNAKYRRWIKEYDDNQAYHKETFKSTLLDLARNTEIQTRKNMEQIITTVSNNAEKNMQRQLNTLVKPHTNEMVANIQKQLDRKFETYTQGLETKYFEKEAELISDLDTYHDKTSEILNEALEDFYSVTVPYTIPPRLTAYIDEHLESRVTNMITAKMATLLDHQATTGIQQQVDRAVQERMQQYEVERQQHHLAELDSITTLTEKNLQLITTANAAATLFLENKRDACMKSLEISRHTMEATITTLRNDAIDRITDKLQEATLALTETKRVIKQDMDDIIEEAKQTLNYTRMEIKKDFKEDMEISKDSLLDSLHEDIEISKEDGKMEITKVTQELKRDLQGDKDRHLHSLINERTRFAQQLTEQAEDEKRKIQALAHAMITQIKSTGDNKMERTSQQETALNTQEQQQAQWHQSHPTQPLYSAMSQTQPPSSQNDPLLQQPSEDSDKGVPTKPPNRFQERVQQRDQELREQHIYERSDKIFDKLHSFKKAQLDYIVSESNPSQEEIEMLYRNIASEMRACHMPIVPFESLTAISGTKPTDEPLTTQMEFIVGKELYLLLTKALPRTNKDLRAIMDSYSQSEDGYGALALIMKTYCPYLKTLQAMWGPPWQPQQTGLEYVATLKRYVGNMNRTSNTQYSTRTIAIELLQQAQQHPRYHNIATHYLTRLTLQPANHPIGLEYEMTRLAGEMDTNQSLDTYHSPTINKMRTEKNTDAKDNNKRREGKFKYKRDVQCTCCHNFGHDVDEQICRIGAQIYHANQFFLNKPTKAKENAQSYSLINSQHQIKMAKADRPDASDDEIQDQLERIALSMVQHIQHNSSTTISNETAMNVTMDE
jgi:hypothetical protein